jgi:asparagine synthase (glutamine-hydrolysing)
MCGIAGIASVQGGLFGERVRQMSSALAHRGPDAEGYWDDDRCALGHRRLAIIDLSPAGRQPMANEDGTIQLTFNGEIYNFQSIRRELEAAGHLFRTRTDSEVIVHAYEQWGVDCVKRFRGMFAFGLWDRRRRRLLLARDRVGKKPLFYTQREGQLLFASELQALLADPSTPRDVDLAAIDAYLSLGYVPAPSTAFRSIRKLPPAHWATFDLTGDEPAFRCERYWQLRYEPKPTLKPDEAAAALREKLVEAVRLRLTSDVPLGAFLSGGIDSTIVVGLMAALSDRPVKTFSIGFEDADFDELPHARRVAERWSTDHHEFIVKPDALGILPMLVRHFGEPFADSSAVPTYYVSKMTRSHVTVALNGDGGDESFAGYERYLGNRWAQRASGIPGFAPAVSGLASLLPATAGARSRTRAARRFLSAAGQPVGARYARWVGASTGHFTDEAKRSLYDGPLLELLDRSEAVGWIDGLFSGSAGLDPIDAAMSVDVESYLPYDLLVKVDITAMSNGLEARSPFLDHEVMELAAKLPVGMKLRGTTSKYILREAFADLLPPENAGRRKMGFGVPLGNWLRGPLRPLLEDVLLSERAAARGYFRREPLRSRVLDHLQNGIDHGYMLWNLLMLELWHRELVDRPASAWIGEPAGGVIAR